MNLLSKIIGVFVPPQDINALLREKRGSPRIRCNIIASITQKGQPAVRSKVLDMGLHGMRLESESPFKQGARVDVNVEPDEGFPLTAYKVSRVPVEVMWCQKKRNLDDLRYILGVKYMDLYRNMKDSWVAFILKKFGFDPGMTLQRRKEVRLASNLPVTYRLASGTEGQGTIYNMGLGGVLLSCKDDPGEVSEISLVIGPIERLEPLSAQGQIRRKKFSKKAESWMIGIHFGDLKEEDVALLGKYLISLLKQPG